MCFRCKVTGVLKGGRWVEVEYRVEGCQRFVHRLN